MYYTKSYKGPKTDTFPSLAAIPILGGWYQFHPLRVGVVYDRIFFGPALLARVDHDTGKYLRQLLNGVTPDDSHRVMPLGDAKEQCHWELTLPHRFTAPYPFLDAAVPSVRVCSERRPWRNRRAGCPRPNPFYGRLIALPNEPPVVLGDDGKTYEPEGELTPRRLYDIYDARATFSGRRLLYQVIQDGWFVLPATP